MSRQKLCVLVALILATTNGAFADFSFERTFRTEWNHGRSFRSDTAVEISVTITETTRYRNTLSMRSRSATGSVTVDYNSSFMRQAEERIVLGSILGSEADANTFFLRGEYQSWARQIVVTLIAPTGREVETYTIRIH